MSREIFSDDCPGCRPALLDVQTGQVLSEESPLMQSVLAVWRCTSRKERLAFHRVTCLNSRIPSDLRVCQAIGGRIAASAASKLP